MSLGSGAWKSRQGCGFCFNTLDCRDQLHARRSVVRCSACGALYHQVCWQEYPRCSNCQGEQVVSALIEPCLPLTPVVFTAAPQALVAMPTSPRSLPWRRLALAGGLVLVIAMGVGLWLAGVLPMPSSSTPAVTPTAIATALAGSRVAAKPSVHPPSTALPVPKRPSTPAPAAAARSVPEPAQPAPANGGAVEQRLVENDQAQIVTRYREWLRAWQEMNLAKFMSYYDPMVRIKRANGPPYDITALRARMPDHWRELRYIKIDDRPPEVTIQGDAATLRVWQHYDSDNWWDEGTKVLVWRKASGEWRIIEEEFLQTQGGRK